MHVFVVKFIKIPKNKCNNKTNDIYDVVFEPKDVKFITNGQELLGTDVSEANPVAFRLGQSGTLVMSGQCCVFDGVNKIVIEAMNPEAGKVQLSVEDVA